MEGLRGYEKEKLRDSRGGMSEGWEVEGGGSAGRVGGQVDSRYTMHALHAECISEGAATTPFAPTPTRPPPAAANCKYAGPGTTDSEVTPPSIIPNILKKKTIKMCGVRRVKFPHVDVESYQRRGDVALRRTVTKILINLR